MSDDPQDDSKPPSCISLLKVLVALPCFLKFWTTPPGPTYP